MQRGNSKADDTRISKQMSYLLRHGGPESGLKMKPDGFVNVSDLLQKVKGCKIEDIQRIVETDSKNRYSLKKDDGLWEIKANQGHSIAGVNELNLKPVLEANFDIIHGTYLDKWNIIRTSGLSRMTRNHIHLAKGTNATSGYRKSSQIFIYIDFHKAVQDGITFYESENGVILSSGNNGILDPKYFKKVVSKNGEIIWNN